jgi:hypothetical protein
MHKSFPPFLRMSANKMYNKNMFASIHELQIVIHTFYYHFTVLNRSNYEKKVEDLPKGILQLNMSK